jgi:hypothetical protein
VRLVSPIEQHLGGGISLLVRSASFDREGRVKAEVEAWHGRIVHSDVLTLSKAAARKRFASTLLGRVGGLTESEADAGLLALGSNLVARLANKGGRVDGPGAKTGLGLNAPAPWPYDVDGAALLDEIVTLCRRLVAAAPTNSDAVTDAGCRRPERTRGVAKLLAGGEVDSESPSILILQELRQLFDEHSALLTSEEIVKHLTEKESRWWAEWKNGKPITPQALAQLLKPFGIHSHKWRDGSKTLRGYRRSDCEEVFCRYLRVETPQSPHAQESPTYDEIETPQDNSAVATTDDCNLLKTKDVATVPSQNRENKETKKRSARSLSIEGKKKFPGHLSLEELADRNTANLCEGPALLVGRDFGHRVVHNGVWGELIEVAGQPCRGNDGRWYVAAQSYPAMVPVEEIFQPMGDMWMEELGETGSADGEGNATELGSRQRNFDDVFTRQLRIGSTQSARSRESMPHDEMDSAQDAEAVANETFDEKQGDTAGRVGWAIWIDLDSERAVNVTDWREHRGLWFALTETGYRVPASEIEFVDD